MAVKRPMRVLGFMTGTSLDAVDMAVLETDGETIAALGPAGERKLSNSARDIVLQATADARGWPRGSAAPESFAVASAAVSREHLEAAQEFLAAHALNWSDFDLIGMHGQTVLHERPRGGEIGRTVQLGDGAWLAAQTGVPVAFDFHSADVAAGGEGAPLAPIYHAALARHSGVELPIAVLNLGGVANITLICADEGALQAFDSGPANGMIDLWLQEKIGARFDQDGRMAAAGRVDEVALSQLLAHPYFSVHGPKSLDRYDFPFDPVRALSVEDGAATLTAFTAAAIGLGVAACAQRPHALIACGGGRHNPTLMRAIRTRAGVDVKSAEEVGWRGDSIEAEAIAFLAARTLRRLPLSFPGTTGVKTPMTGGVIARP